MARYGFNWEQTLTVETNEADREKVTTPPPLTHRCAAGDGYFRDWEYQHGEKVSLPYDNPDKGMYWNGVQRGWSLDDTSFYGYEIPIRFCPFCGVDLAILVPKE